MTRDAMVLNETTGQPALDLDPMLLPDLGGGRTSNAIIALMDSARRASDSSRDRYAVVWCDTLTTPVVRCDDCGGDVLVSDATVLGDADGDYIVCSGCA